jgi:hypothetical protein
MQWFGAVKANMPYTSSGVNSSYASAGPYYIQSRETGRPWPGGLEALGLLGRRPGEQRLGRIGLKQGPEGFDPLPQVGVEPTQRAEARLGQWMAVAVEGDVHAEPALDKGRVAVLYVRCTPAR